MLDAQPFNTIYVAKPEFMKELCHELGEITDIVGNLVFSPVRKTDICFALDVWYEPVVIHFASISDAAKQLRQAGKFWFLNPIEQVRRSLLIAEQLRKLPPLERAFPMTEAIPSIGCFSLLDKNTLVFSTKRWKPWPLGHCAFIEDKINPPNRAYLKLWEALTLLNHYPAQGESALDLGASPGGWTYVLQSLGASVTAVDKAELEPRIACLPNVHYLKQSAFGLEPNALPKMEWVFSDVACYPDRLYDLVIKWLAKDNLKQLIFTIKLQGETDFASLKRFQDIPKSRTLHMYHNKHEATFFYPAPPHLFAECI